jgi:hypothetical protein
MTRLQGEVRFSGLDRWAAELAVAYRRYAVYCLNNYQEHGGFRVAHASRQKIFVKVVTPKSHRFGQYATARRLRAR